MFSFENLDAYKQARILVKDVYELLKTYPREEHFALCDQLRRAVISVPSNIAEGLSRKATKEQLHFLQISYGSLMEVLCQMGVSTDLGYISEIQYNEIRTQITIVSKLILGLHYALEKKSIG